MIRVLFVCLGNICRSPMAEAVFAEKVRVAGLSDTICADSAGTGHWHIGSQAHPGTRRVLAQNEIPYDGRARVLVASDLERFDYILTMDDENLRDVLAIGRGTAKVGPLMSYAPETGFTEVPDPYYDGNFERTYALTSAASEGFLESLRRDHNL
jgi:protein-tyrosine phosphatase